MILLHKHNPVLLSPPPSLSPNPIPSSLRPRFRFRCHSRPEWEASAESVRPGRFGPRGLRPNRGGEGGEEGEAFEREEKRRWWSDYNDDGYESLNDDYDEFDLFDDELDESIWDKFWFLKVQFCLLFSFFEYVHVALNLKCYSFNICV